MELRFKKNFILLLALLILLSAFKISAQNNSVAQDNGICEEPTKIDEQCAVVSSQDCRKILEECQNYFEDKISVIEKGIAETEEQKKTLQSQISILKNKIKNLDYKISQLNLNIKELTSQIGETQINIDDTSTRIDDSRQKLAVILRSIHETDQNGLVEILVSEDTLSGFFDDLIALETLHYKSQKLLENIKDLKTYLEAEKQSLDAQKGEMENLVIIQKLQKSQSESTKKDQEYYLKLTEAEYQKKLKEKQEVAKSAAEISSRIFELIGVPKAPTFGEAYEIAKFISGITGIRPAFLLAVLTQESNIGKNVGQCYLKNPDTGEGIVASTGKAIARVMKPTRDVQPFLSVTQEINRDPYNTLVSCPMSFGWGGAMGPAQFIPSTWLIYKERISGIIGKTADPWVIKDSFVAAALYLVDYGAASRTKDAEWKAAMIYFSGGTNKKFSWYGDSVMKMTSQYEEDIKALEAAAQ